MKSFLSYKTIKFLPIPPDMSSILYINQQNCLSFKQPKQLFHFLWTNLKKLKLTYINKVGCNIKQTFSSPSNLFFHTQDDVYLNVNNIIKAYELTINKAMGTLLCQYYKSILSLHNVRISSIPVSDNLLQKIMHECMVTVFTVVRKWFYSMFLVFISFFSNTLPP